MSDFDVGKTVGASTLVEDPQTGEAATPGRSSRTESLDAAHKPSLFSGREQWEDLDAEASAPEAGGDVLGEVKAELQDEMTALAEAHRCHAGCAHAQFDMMMSAQTSQAAGFKLAPGVLEEARRNYVESQGGGPKPAEPTAAAPLPDHGASVGESDQAGFAGTVSPGKPGGFPGVLGLAKWNFGKFGYPDLQIDTAKQSDKSWNATIKTTTSKDAPTSAVATPVGQYNIGTEKQPHPTTNKNVTMKRILDIDATAHGQIKTAEQEHLDDITQAYTITLKAAEDAVNAKAGTPFNSAKKADAITAAKDAVKAALDPKLTADPKKWRTMLQKAAAITTSTRDAKKWHTFNYTGTNVDFTAKTVTYTVDPNPNVGTTSSASLIKLP